MIQTKSEDAVSPVIGVMLMLVITIVIAAVVAVFASGVGVDVESAPSTVLDVTNIRQETTFSDDLEFSSYYINDELEELLDDAEDGEYVEYGGLKFKYNDAGFPVLENGESLFESKESNWGTQPDLSKPKAEYLDWLVEHADMEGEVLRVVTLTFCSKAGDVLNKEKLSVKVYNRAGELVSEMPQNTLSGTLNPGDTVTVPMSEITSVTMQTVEIVILYGEHIVTSEELMVR